MSAVAPPVFVMVTEAVKTCPCETGEGAVKVLKVNDGTVCTVMFGVSGSVLTNAVPLAWSLAFTVNVGVRDPGAALLLDTVTWNASLADAPAAREDRKSVV